MGDFSDCSKAFFQLSKHSLASFLKEHGKIIAQWASELHSRLAHSRATPTPVAEQVPEAAEHKQHTGNQNYTLEIELKQKYDLW